MRDIARNKADWIVCRPSPKREDFTFTETIVLRYSATIGVVDLHENEGMTASRLLVSQKGLLPPNEV